MALAALLEAPGGPEKFILRDVDPGMPGPGEVRLRQTAIGLNFIDTYNRSGLYKVTLPSIIGMEGAGIVTAVGEGVLSVKTGDRVGYASAPLGAYAAERLMPAARLIKLPDFIDDKTAASILVKGMSAEYLVLRTYPVKKDDWILVHAAAGGVGSILCQWARHLGAHVIATAGSDDKCRLALSHGAAHAINYVATDFAGEVAKITNGKGVHAVYDGVGAATFMGSLDCLRPLGMMISYGNASGPVPAFEPRLLASKGSLFFTRPNMWHYTMTEEDYQKSARDLFAAVKAGAVKIAPPIEYSLSDVAQAHYDLEARKITGSAILIP